MTLPPTSIGNVIREQHGDNSPNVSMLAGSDFSALIPCISKYQA